MLSKSQLSIKEVHESAYNIQLTYRSLVTVLLHFGLDILNSMQSIQDVLRIPTRLTLRHLPIQTLRIRHILSQHSTATLDIRQVLIGHRAVTPAHNTVLTRGHVRPLDHQHLRQDVDKHPLHPERHLVRAGLAVVQVEDEYGEEDAQVDEDEREQQVLAQQGDHQRGGRYQVDEEQVEDEQGDQNRYAQGELLAAVAGQVEDEHGEEGDVDAGDDQVDGVEERLAPDGDVEVDVEVAVGAAVVVLDVLLGGDLEDVPLDRLVVVGHVDAGLDGVQRPGAEVVGVALGDGVVHVDVLQVDKLAAEGPRAEFHVALLDVEGVVLDVDGAVGLVDHGRFPDDAAVVVDGHFGLGGDLVVAVGAWKGVGKGLCGMRAECMCDGGIYLL